MAEDPDASVAEREELLFLLNRVRDAVVRTLDGLDERALRAPGVPSGTNLLGLVRHLTAMEVQWFHQIFLGEGESGTGSMRVPDGVGRDEVVAAYREAGRRSDAIVRAAPGLSAPSAGLARLPESTSRDAPPAEPRTISLRLVVAHLLEETARHAGHADILRELTDGETDL